MMYKAIEPCCLFIHESTIYFSGVRGYNINKRTSILRKTLGVIGFEV